MDDERYLIDSPYPGVWLIYEDDHTIGYPFQTKREAEAFLDGMDYAEEQHRWEEEHR